MDATDSETASDPPGGGGKVRSYRFDKYTDEVHKNAETGILHNRFVNDHLDDVFEPIPIADSKVVILGEIVSAEAFEASPVCIHYLFELPKGWRNDSPTSMLSGATNSCYATSHNKFHFSYSFFSQLAYSQEDAGDEAIPSRPIVLLMVASMLDASRVKFEGYGYFLLPAFPGQHEIIVRTWKPRPRTIEEQMAQLFIDVSPSLQDIRAVHIPHADGEGCRRANRLGLQTDPSGSILIRLHIMHQCPTTSKLSSDKFALMDKMSTATIFKSVQSVIEAFQRARKRAETAKLSAGKISVR